MLTPTATITITVSFTDPAGPQVAWAIAALPKPLDELGEPQPATGECDIDEQAFESYEDW